MRPTEVTKEDIIAAGQALIQAGRSVTGFALRQRTGGGNATRLRQVWDEYLALSATPAEPAADLPVEVADEVAKVSAELADRLSKVVTDLNDKAVKAAERRVSEVVRAATEQRQQAERELADASTTVDELESSLAEANVELERLKAALAECQATQQAQAVALAKAEQQLADERHRGEQLVADLATAKREALDSAKLQGKVDALTEQNSQLIARLDGNRSGT